MRSFAGIDLGREAVPDATPLLKFRHRLEAPELGQRIFEGIGALLVQKQRLMREGTLIAASITRARAEHPFADGERAFLSAIEVKVVFFPAYPVV